MDLREKPGILQRFGEIILRFRLVFVVVLAIACGAFFAGYTELLTFALAVSESIGIRVAEGNFLNLWPWLLLLAAALAPSFLLGGKKSGFTALALCILLPLAFFALQGSEAIVLPVLIALAIVSLVLLVVLKHSFGCAAFPAFLSAVGFVGVVGNFSLFSSSRLEVATYVTLIVIDIFAVSLIAGTELSSGAPKNGALLEGIRKQFFPAIVTALLAGIFYTVYGADYSGAAILRHALLALLSIVFFFFLSLPLLTFTPFARLRAEKREMNVPRSTGVKKK